MPTTLVIGGTSGVGLAVAEQLSRREDTVHIAGRRKGRMTDATAAVEGAHGHVLDAGDPEAVRTIAASIAPIQRLVITLAGSGGAGPLAELTVDDLRRAFEEKYWPTVTALKASLPHLARDASVTLVGAITARTAMSGTAGIGSLNAAVEGLVRPLAAELAPIRVNAVSPGYIDTLVGRPGPGGPRRLLRPGDRSLANQADRHRLRHRRGDRAVGHQPQHHRNRHRNGRRSAPHSVSAAR